MTDASPDLQRYLDYLFSHGPVWAYSALFLACFIENLFPPFPGDSFVVAGGGLVALDRLNYLPALFSIVAGGMCSVMLLYLFGLRYGRDYFLRKNYRYFGVRDITQMEARLVRWGALILIGSRFVVGLRTVLTLAAGIGRYPIGKMILFSLLSYLLFTALLMYLADALVTNFNVIEQYFRTYNRIIWPIMIVVVVIWFWRKWRPASDRKNGPNDR
ncbi:MAG: DedA family protein [Candidatus Zixiibacteriota bacterium]